ncbi:MAG: hypothetical protein JXB10_16690 [Pirellulales bacterium]|nr:hypothetical protein [Pirellulales bacterium]
MKFPFSPAVGLLVLLSFGQVGADEAADANSRATSAPIVNQRQYFEAPKIVGREDAFCRRAYRVMLKGAAFCKDLYHPWPTESDCGYLGWGGHGEKEISANIQLAHLYALLITFGRYDEQVTGVSREEALRRVKGVIRYCCFTHVTGPHPCTSGKHWGGGWHGASWSTVLAHTVWLVWPELDDPTREMATRVITAEADRFLGVDPPSGKINNTMAESNAWNTRALAVAAVMFPRHPRAPQWRRAYQRWAMNVFSVADDRRDDTPVDGRPVREWVTTENIHPDFTLENHGIVYPVYMWASMNGLCQSALYHIVAGQKPPQAAFHHLRDVYEVYKRLQTWEGLPAYVNGSDKFLHLQVVDIVVHSFFAQVFQDREAALLEAIELDILERMQARFNNGRLYPVAEVGRWSRVGNLSVALGGSYLLHYVCRADVTPVGRCEFDRRITGVSYFPDGNFLLHRTPEKLVSFAWSKPHRVMGLVIPREGSWLVTPHVRGFTGTIREQGRPDKQIFQLEKIDKTVHKDSFSVSVIALRCNGKVEHRLTFESLSGPDVLMREKLTALKPVILDEAETGTVGIGRELGRDQITLESARGEKTTVGGFADPVNRTFEFPEGQVTVDGRFIYRWQGDGTPCYFQWSKVSRVGGAPGGYGHLEDRLAVRHIKSPRKFAAGEVIAEGELQIHVLPFDSPPQ